MTPDVLVRATGCTAALAEVFADPLSLAMAHFGVTTPMRQAMFLPNAAHECNRFATLIESLDYSVDGLLGVFGRHRISEEDARLYGRIKGKQAANQEAIANCVYGGEWGAKNLGNVRPGDGWKFRGAGVFQSTGRANAARTRDKLRIEFPKHNVPDFEANPEFLLQPLYASLAAGLYWFNNELVLFADRGDFDGVCDKINFGRKTQKLGDSNGYADRVALFDRTKVALGIA